ncbi:Gfo/Idh/MocA family oxidoreductase [Eubacteriales bacterium OttesenSCG-928-N13]|nr:Gfo/Idh/MocA family oxidoreductase [Eubacteriales bacterium OttesenSCG-928-N13]
MKHQFAVLGLGHWYSAYPLIGAIQSLPDTQVKWIVDENIGQARQTARMFSVERHSADYMDALLDPEVDAVLIATPTYLHEQLAVDAARHKKHILLGKPVARTLASAERIRQAVKQSGVTLLGYGAGPNPTDPLIQLVREGTVGTPYAVTSSFRARLPLRAPGDTDPGWFVDSGKASGGAFIDHAIYMATRMRALFDSPAKSVYARMRKMARPELQVEDYGVAIIEYESGALATVESSFGATEYSQTALVLSATQGEIGITDDELRITRGRESRITKLTGPNPVLLTIADVMRDPFGARETGYYQSVIQEFVDVIDHGAPSLNTLENGIEGLMVCLAAYKSLEIGQPVALPLKEDVDVQSIMGRLDVFHG